MRGPKSNASELPRGSSRPISRILVAIDGTHLGRRAVDVGAHLAERCCANLAVLHVVDTIRGIAPPCAWGSRSLESEQVEAGRMLIDAMVEKLPSSLQVTTILRSGDPSVEIIRAANEHRADLLIVGEPSHRRLGRLVLGSIDESLLDQTRCSLLILRRDAEETVGGPKR